MSENSFKVELAIAYGVEIACFIDVIYLAINDMLSRDRGIPENDYWIMLSSKVLSTLFPYFSTQKSIYLLQACVHKELLAKRTFNPEGISYNMYTFTDKMFNVYPRFESKKICVSNIGLQDINKNKFYN